MTLADNITFARTAATINPGSSGGPLLNKDGEGLGSVTSAIFEKFSLATSANTVKLPPGRIVEEEVITG